MKTPPSSDWKLGERAIFTDCYGSNKKEGIVTQIVGPYSLAVQVGRETFTVPTGLIVDPFDLLD